MVDFRMAKTFSKINWFPIVWVLVNTSSSVACHNKILTCNFLDCQQFNAYWICMLCLNIIFMQMPSQPDPRKNRLSTKVKGSKLINLISSFSEPHSVVVQLNTLTMKFKSLFLNVQNLCICVWDRLLSVCLFVRLYL